MKSKYLAFGLSTLLVLSLASCGGQQTPKPEEIQEPQQKVQQAEPISAQPVMEPEEVKQEIVPTASEIVPEEKPNTQDGDVSSEADAPEEIDPAVELFEAVEGGEQTVYVTGTVNIRSTWSTEGEKLGAFNKGQAIVRVGVGIEGTEAEGWSQIKVSDGQAEDGTEQFKLVYVSNKYLSTTKPSSGSQQASKPSGSQTQTPASKPSGGQSQTSKPAQDQQQTQQPTTSSTPSFGEPGFDIDAFNEQLRQQQQQQQPKKETKWAEFNGDNASFTEEEIEDIHLEFSKQYGYID